MKISTIFDKYAKNYDQNRRMLIPCFDRFYAAVVNLLPFSTQAGIQVLDLGSGTGLLSRFILARFPNAHLTLMDSSTEMLKQARQRFRHKLEQVQIIPGDYRYNLPGGPFDAVVSALSIHHIEEKEKFALFIRLSKIMSTNSIFINADQVLGETTKEEKLFRANWLEAVLANGISPTKLTEAHERMKEDRMSKLSVQLKGLQSAGFQNVACSFQDHSFVVYSGCIKDQTNHEV